MVPSPLARLPVAQAARNLVTGWPLGLPTGSAPAGGTGAPLKPLKPPLKIRVEKVKSDIPYMYMSCIYIYILTIYLSALTYVSKMAPLKLVVQPCAAHHWNPQVLRIPMSTQTLL